MPTQSTKSMVQYGFEELLFLIRNIYIGSYFHPESTYAKKCRFSDTPFPTQTCMEICKICELYVFGCLSMRIHFMDSFYRVGLSTSLTELIFGG